MVRLLRRLLAVSLLVGVGIWIGALWERKGWGGLRPGAALKEAGEKLRDAPRAAERAIHHYWHDDAHIWAHWHSWPYYYPSGWWVVERREPAPAQTSGGGTTVAPGASVELRAEPPPRAEPPQTPRGRLLRGSPQEEAGSAGGVPAPRLRAPAPARPAGARRKSLTEELLE